ncbi:hypothetical protein D030_0629A, partial [Vibrio parahaemolyticus AQ3810]
MRFSTFNAM